MSSSLLVTKSITLEPIDNRRLSSLCGPFDDNIKQIEKRLGVEISYNNTSFKVVGKDSIVEATLTLLKNLYVETQPVKGELPEIEPEQVHLAIQACGIMEQKKRCRLG